MNFKDVLKKSLPWIGAAATGNIPVLVGLAAEAVGNALGTTIDADPVAITEAVQGATPEQLIALKKAEQDFAADMQRMGYAHAEEMGRQDLAVQSLYVADTADARKTHAGDKGVFAIAVAILLSFAIMAVTVLVGCFQLLTGSAVFKGVDPATVGIVSGLIGTLIGYLAANAQQVVSYFFGSSQGSKNSGDAVRKSLDDALKKLAAAPPR